MSEATWGAWSGTFKDPLKRKNKNEGKTKFVSLFSTVCSLGYLSYSTVKIYVLPSGSRKDKIASYR